MTVKELYKKIDGLPEATRMERIKQLLRLLSPPSLSVLRKFKKEWKGPKSEQFIEARNKEIKKCIEWELSFVGITTRAIQGLRCFGWDTELDTDTKNYDAKKVGSNAAVKKRK